MNLAPFKFKPIFKSVLWGGNKIAPFKGVNVQQSNIGECWEISGVRNNESIVSEGSDENLKLHELIDKYAENLVGKENFKKFGNIFPLLIKFIDAKQDLSLQVHPNDDMARKRHDSFGKTEMWYLIDSEPGSKIYSGLSKKISFDDYEAMIQNNSIMDIVASHNSLPDQLFYLPAGRVHSIGAGNFLLEVQQTSDITYRIYDFNRKDTNGKLRELHTQEAKEAIDYKVYDDYVLNSHSDNPGANRLIDCNYFKINRINIKDEIDIDLQNLDSFLILVNISGKLRIKDNNDNNINLNQGETVLIPAITSKIILEGNAKIISVTN